MEIGIQQIHIHYITVKLPQNLDTKSGFIFISLSSLKSRQSLLNPNTTNNCISNDSNNAIKIGTLAKKVELLIPEYQKSEVQTVQR